MTRLAVISGASAGIGKATLEAFAEAGWQVIGLDIQPASGLPANARFERLDVSHPEAVEAFFGRLTESEGRLDALVNNAAMPMDRRLSEITVAAWDRVQQTNLRSVFLTARHAHPLLKAARGAIVNVGSVHAVATSTHISAYAASKGGVLALTRALALELGADGIRVNAVLPGAVDTPMLRQGLDRDAQARRTTEDRLDELKRRTPLGRIGRPEEIARAILFLSDGEQSSFITGEALVVDGGALARLSTE